MKKIILRVISVFVILVLCAAFSRNFIAKKTIGGVVKSITGLSLNIDSLNIGVFKTLINIEGLKLDNPAGFADKTMMDVPEIYIDYKIGSLLKKKIHLEELRLYLKEFTVVKNENGVLNISAMKTMKGGEKQEGAAKEETKEEKPLPLQIDLLELKIDRVIYKDYSQGAVPVIKEYNVYLNEKYTDITDAEKLVKLILYRAMFNTVVANLVNLDINLFRDDLSGILKRATGILQGSSVEINTKEIEKIGKEVFGGGEDAAQKTKDVLKKVFEGIKLPENAEEGK